MQAKPSRAPCRGTDAWGAWLREQSLPQAARCSPPHTMLHTDRQSILVTGGAGFLGSWLCEQLLERGHEVLCVDNFFTGSKRNIAHLLDHPRFELMRHDVTFPLYLEVDRIFNFACPA